MASSTSRHTGTAHQSQSWDSGIPWLSSNLAFCVCRVSIPVLIPKLWPFHAWWNVPSKRWYTSIIAELDALLVVFLREAICQGCAVPLPLRERKNVHGNQVAQVTLEQLQVPRPASLLSQLCGGETLRRISQVLKYLLVDTDPDDGSFGVLISASAHVASIWHDVSAYLGPKRPLQELTRDLKLSQES